MDSSRFNGIVTAVCRWHHAPVHADRMMYIEHVMCRTDRRFASVSHSAEHSAFARTLFRTVDSHELSHLFEWFKTVWNGSKGLKGSNDGGDIAKVTNMNVSTRHTESVTSRLIFRPQKGRKQFVEIWIESYQFGGLWILGHNFWLTFRRFGGG